MQPAGSEIVTNTELPPLPKPIVKAYRIQLKRCAHCRRQVRGQHAEVAPDQWGATAHRLGPRAQAAAQLLHYEDGLPIMAGVRQLPSNLVDIAPTIIDFLGLPAKG